MKQITIAAPGPSLQTALHRRVDIAINSAGDHVAHDWLASNDAWEPTAKPRLGVVTRSESQAHWHALWPNVTVIDACRFCQTMYFSCEAALYFAMSMPDVTSVRCFGCDLAGDRYCNGSLMFQPGDTTPLYFRQETDAETVIARWEYERHRLGIALEVARARHIRIEGIPL